MRRTCFRKMHCPIARSRERVGEWWSILILRDAPHGYRRFDEFQGFDEFQESLGVATERIHRRYARRKVEAGAA
jgi:DNA-binding HxlR family transcriptional regulator